MIEKIYAVWVYVNDLKESREFYEKILGLKFKLQQIDWIEFDLGETSFALLKKAKNETSKVPPQKTRIMFQVDNLEKMKKILEKNKVKIIQIVTRDYGRYITFEDPNGHWLELFEAKKKEKFK